MGLFLTVADPVFAQSLPFPKITISAGEANNPQDVAVGIQILFLLTILTLAPAILVMFTSFTRIVVVLSCLRHAMGTQQMPPNQVLIGLALFLTFFVMAPVGEEINRTALQPYLAKKIGQEEALKRASVPVRGFMFRQTREQDLALMVSLAKVERPKNPDGVPTHVLVPAFAISELKTAFQLGFVIFIPFLIIDMVVASVLMSMGMMMLPPILISLPFKILLFVLADGWHLVVRSLVTGFR
ncbi:MAG TPA: flagellar type III secretion system pore protein FliP [Methylomirabilota bacterium]|nr:flagellar type III secretion system pore protein FliP [Methylomirabilota bacterium]